MTAPITEPWLSGEHQDVDPVLRPILYCLEQAKQDLRHWTTGISEAEVWAGSHGLAPIGFQLRHIAGSVDRLYTYCLGEKLSDVQMAFLRSEMEPGASLEELMKDIETTFGRVELGVRNMALSAIRDHRAVGRKQLPTTVIGLLIHIAEHTQRHVGQAIVTAQVLKSS